MRRALVGVVAEMAELRGHRAQLRKTLAAFWVQIGGKTAQQVTAS